MSKGKGGKGGKRKTCVPAAVAAGAAAGGLELRRWWLVLFRGLLQQPLSTSLLRRGDSCCFRVRLRLQAAAAPRHTPRERLRAAVCRPGDLLRAAP